MSRIHVKSDTQIHVIFLIFGDPEEECKPGELQEAQQRTRTLSKLGRAWMDLYVFCECYLANMGANSFSSDVQLTTNAD